jgi:ABC-type multidrug transport system ATPase subunit/predicted component of type VI protein secretion system
VTLSGTIKLILDAQGSSAAREFELIKSEIVLGRDDGVDITIPSPAVSRRHARFMLEGDGYIIEDLGSSNGTFINGNRLIGRRALKPGDQIRLGQTITLRYDAPTVEAPATGMSTSVESTPLPSIASTRASSSVPAHVRQTTIGEDIDLPVAAGPRRLIVSIAGGETKTHMLTRPTLTIGRVEGNDIVISSPIVSGKHARLEPSGGGGYKLVVLPEARNPVLFEGRPLDGSRVLRHGDMLRIGSQDPGVMVTMTYDAPAEASQQLDRDIVFGEKTLVQIGRDPGNDVVLPSPSVSRFHAQVQRVGQRYRVEDLRSSNGTFVNGNRIEGQVWLKPDDTIRIGQFRFVVGKDQLAQVDESRGMRVEAVGLNKWVRQDLNILQNISVAIQPREFIVVVGQSGGGKSTFVDSVAGYRPATQPSKVYVNDVDIYQNFDSIRNEIGFVPQKDIIHMELTVYQALDYAAQLRMPADTTPAEREKRIMEVLEDLDLTHRKDVQISGLSGGQQKRVSIGVELLTKPGLFFLDEPTSGLDPGTETALMQLMRRLADQGRTIILITHATKNVMLADKVIFLARGGYLAWFGPPDEALAYFDQHRSERERRAGKIEFDEIYAILDDPGKGKAADWANRYAQSKAYQDYIAKPLAGKFAIHSSQQPTIKERPTGTANTKQVSSLRQFMILSSRNIKILTRDRTALRLMLLAAPIVSLLDVIFSLVLGRTPFDYYEGGMANVMITLFFLAIYGIMVGGMSQMREIVKEQDIYKRERLVNLKILPYVISKIWVAALLAAYQAAVYTIVHYLAFKVPGGVMEFVLIYITMVLVTFAGMMLGLFASALAPNANSAPLIVIILLLPQIVLGGAVIPIPPSINVPISSRWAFESMIAITGSGSDVAADLCWKLPPDVRDSMTLEQKLESNCRCMGVNILNPESCNHPGIGTPGLTFEGDSLPVQPIEPVLVIPPEPVQPENQSDTIAMAEYFAQLEKWRQEGRAAEEQFNNALATYRRDVGIYADSRKEIEQAVGIAEGLVRTFYTGLSWAYVDKDDTAAYLGKVTATWFVQFLICVILFVAILYLQKRKDVI